ncbi:MAG: NADH-quinone oxidoreductase subunit J [Akkermansia sp.]|nr:NADH-quinone oxidoreductase subunit J [Akkermansia sp.]
MFESALCQIIFYVFAALALLCAVGVVAFRNPVTSAMNMALCFGLVSAILFGLGAQFLGIIQIIIYAGAILVLFVFVIMMLDIKAEEHSPASWLPAVGGTVVAAVFAGMVMSVSMNLPGAKDGSCPAKTLWDNIGELSLAPQPQQAEAPAKVTRFGGALPALSPAAAAKALNPDIAPEQAANATTYPDVKLVGHTLFTQYNIPFVILGFALLSGSVGAMALARKYRKD